MQRRVVAGLGTLVGVLVLVAGRPALGQEGAGKKVVLQVLVPHEDAKVKIDGESVGGKGEKRRLAAKLAPGKDSLMVEAIWEPNSYTKIFRKRKVTPGDQNEIVVDLRKEDPKQKDHIEVIYVPTPQDVVEAMCKMAKIGPNDVVYDLGCGDGRMVITAVKKFGAKRGVGVDIDPKRIEECKENADLKRINDKVEFRVGDVLKIKDLPDATVVLLYMGDDINNRLRPILQKTLKPGARVVSHRFKMGDWQPDRSETVQSGAGYPCVIHLWTIKGDKSE
jgi:predicted RNA methylase